MHSFYVGTFDSEGAALKRFEGAEVHHNCWGFHMGSFLFKEVDAPYPRNEGRG